MKNGLTKYYQIFSSIPEGDYEKSVGFLKESISNLFLEDYYAQFTNSEILEFNVNGYIYLFDLNIETESNKIEKADRVMAVYGRISQTNAKRDRNRMKAFIGPFTKIAKYKDFDKGYFISHKINVASSDNDSQHCAIINGNFQNYYSN